MQGTSEVRSVKWLIRFIDQDEDLRRLKHYAEEALSLDPGHDYAHALRVAYWGLRIGKDEVDRRQIVAAALLHDIVNPPKNSQMRSQASRLSAQEARKRLPEYGFAPAEVDQIAEAIRDHSYSRGATPAHRLGRVLQDADRLEALGAVGIMRCVSTGVQMGGQLFDAFDPWGEIRPLDDKSFAVDHFFTKLFKLTNTMQTEAGRAEAARRVRVMEDFLRALGDEIGDPWTSPVKT